VLGLDLGGQLVRPRLQVRYLRVRPAAYLLRLLVGQRQHVPHPLADVLRGRQLQPLHLRPLRLDLAVRRGELGGEIGGPGRGKVPVGKRDAQLRLQPIHVLVHLAAVVAAQHHVKLVDRAAEGQ
jgi:hypothetical protein